MHSWIMNPPQQPQIQPLQGQFLKIWNYRPNHPLHVTSFHITGNCKVYVNKSLIS